MDDYPHVIIDIHLELKLDVYVLTTYSLDGKALLTHTQPYNPFIFLKLES